MFSESEKQIALFGQVYLELGKFVAPIMGGIVSLYGNPFVAEAGFVKGVVAHSLVAAATGIAFYPCAWTGALSAAIPGVFLSASRKFHNRAMTTLGFTLSAGMVAGSLWGSIEACRTSSHLLKHGTHSYKKAANETSSRERSSVRWVRDGNKVSVRLPQSALGG